MHGENVSWKALKTLKPTAKIYISRVELQQWQVDILYMSKSRRKIKHNQKSSRISPDSIRLVRLSKVVHNQGVVTSIASLTLICSIMNFLFFYSCLLPDISCSSQLIPFSILLVPFPSRPCSLQGFCHSMWQTIWRDSFFPWPSVCPILNYFTFLASWL